MRVCANEVSTRRAPRGGVEKIFRQENYSWPILPSRTKKLHFHGANTFPSDSSSATKYGFYYGDDQSKNKANDLDEYYGTNDVREYKKEKENKRNDFH